MKITIRAKTKRGKDAIMKHVSEFGKMPLSEKAKARFLYNEKIVSVNPFVFEMHSPKLEMICNIHKSLKTEYVMQAKSMVRVVMLKNGARREDYTFEVV